jgi:hypothetical protein
VDAYPQIDPAAQNVWETGQNGEDIGTLCIDLNDPDDGRCAEKYVETDETQDFEVFNSQNNSFTVDKNWYDVMMTPGGDEYEQVKLEPADPATGACEGPTDCAQTGNETCVCYRYRKMKRQVLLNRCCEEVYERWAPIMIDDGMGGEMEDIVEEGFMCSEENYAHPNPMEGDPPPHALNQVQVQVINGCDTEMWWYLDQVELEKKFNRLRSCDGSWEFITLEDVSYKNAESIDILILPGSVCGCIPPQ